MKATLEPITVEKIKMMSRSEFHNKFVGDIARSEAFGQLFFCGIENISDEDKQTIVADFRRNGYEVPNDDELDRISIAVNHRAVTLR